MLNFVSADNLNIFVFFPRKQNLTFHANCLQMSCLLEKKTITNMLSAENVQSANHQFSADDIFEIVFLFFSQVTGFDISCTLSQLETVCMKCQILLAEKTKKVSSNILSAGIIQRVVKVRGTSNLLLH